MGRRWLLFGVVALVVAVALLVFYLRTPTYVATAKVFVPNRANDTVVIVRGWDEADLTKILADFTRSYENRLPSAEPFSVERERDEFRIRFPEDIPPPLLSFLVNYLQYPKGLEFQDRQVAAVAIVTLTDAFALPNDTYLGKQARIYVPSNDKRYDEVYIAVGPQGYGAERAEKIDRGGRTPPEGGAVVHGPLQRLLGVVIGGPL